MATDSFNFDSFAKLGESLGELEVTVGPAARPVIAEVRMRLAEAAAKHNNGDTAGAIGTIRSAMQRLASLAGIFDPAEAMLMRMIGEYFSNALRAGDKHGAKDAVNLMRRKAGDPKDEPNSDW
jgi:hypothetical protein